MYEFNYHRPGTLEAASSALAAADDGRVLAGGQTLIPTLKQRLANPSDLVDLGSIAGLDEVRREGDAVVIGAMTRHADVASSPEVEGAIPALASLADAIGDPQVRNSGTLGGSIANADPAADYPAAVVGLGAEVRTDRRTIAGDDFFTGLFETALSEGEIIVSVRFPIPRRAAYAKFPNPASRYAIVGVMVAETGSGVRVAVTGAGRPGLPGRRNGGRARRQLQPRCARGRLGALRRAERGYPRERRVPRPPRRSDGEARGRGGRLTRAGRARIGIDGSADRGRAVLRMRFIPEPMTLPATVDETASRLSEGDYVAERSLATAVFLTLRMRRPLFLEGEAGVGKTEVARVLARVLGRRLVRLQCYEGLDVASAVYEWNYPRQMIRIRLAELGGEDRGASSVESVEDDIFSRRFLIERPLLDALNPDPAGAPVLLIDELDRADEPFEAYLLELLADFQITIPELGTIAASEPPIVVITSNRTREIHDAIKRRCYYHWVDYPDAARELEILRVRAPGTPEALSQEVVAFVQSLRGIDLFKVPGVAETIDWAQALTQLDVLALSPDVVNDTLGSLLKYQDDIARIRGSEAANVIEQIKRELGVAGAA